MSLKMRDYLGTTGVFQLISWLMLLAPPSEPIVSYRQDEQRYNRGLGTSSV